jgi:hypothetical protein
MCGKGYSLIGIFFFFFSYLHWKRLSPTFHPGKTPYTYPQVIHRLDSILISGFQDVFLSNLGFVPMVFVLTGR